MEKTAVKKKTTAKTNGNGTATMAQGSHDSMLHDYFTDSLKDIYYAEKHLVKALPKMAKAATSPELKQAFADHLEATKVQAGRLEEVFGLLGMKPQGKKCDAIEGLTKEAESIIEDTEAGTATRDVGLIMAAQKVEHYEIATYGGLAQLASTLGLKEIKNLLGTTLDEEKEADTLLTDIAENSVNYCAAEEPVHA